MKSALPKSALPVLLLAGFSAAVFFWKRPDPDSSSSAAAAPEIGRLSFNQHIQPILSENCYQCHGPDSGSREADLRLDREEFAFAVREDGPVLVPGDPDGSPLIRRIESTMEDQIMPPPDSHKELTPAEIALLRRWVEEGAVYEEHWAYLAPQSPPLPETRSDWGENPVDQFILARLEEAGVAPSPEADRYSLIRRVSFDLTGLPPTPEEVAAFLEDDRPGAYERVVDRLLASPRYGEHRARYWLDAVRYGDTHGLHYDNTRIIWPYRDYVIRSFNDNKPFDEFTVEQLAGDLLPAEAVDQLVATGFNRAHVTSNEFGAIPEELQFNIVTDRVETVGNVFLGMTAACAACHDHKFDPISQKEFYQLSAFFNNTADNPFDGNFASPWPTLLIPPPERRAEADAVLKERAAVQRQLSRHRAEADQRMRDWLGEGRSKALEPVSPQELLLRLRFDEGAGISLRNSAPGAAVASYELEGQASVWGETIHFWPSARFTPTTRLAIPQMGDFERTDAFTLAGWFKGREGGVNRSGSVVSKMLIDQENRGWELYWEDASTVETRRWPEGRLVVNLVHRGKENAISVKTEGKVGRLAWVHIAFSYDGSGRASGVHLYVDGRPQKLEIVQDALDGSIRTAAPLQLGRRTDGEPFSEASYQDLRLYGRRLTDAEIARVKQEDVVWEIAGRPMEEWNRDQLDVARDFYLSVVDAPSIALREEERRLNERLKAIGENGVATLISEERPGRPTAYVLERGVYSERRDRVGPDVPAVLPRLEPDAPRDRLGLARWLVSKENPLTARVTVNRMWQELFGTGLVDTPGDFGVVGSRPSHPELLDWLAVDFRRSGWDVKRFYRQLVTSATYRQSARVRPEILEKDPDNRLLARGPRFRLDAEMIRDSALAASGLLVDRIGGPSVNTYQPPGIWEAVTYLTSDTFTHKQASGEALYRRSVYTFWKRTAAPPSLATFDAPQRDVCIVRRERTNTPLQALVTLNAPDFLEAARHLAGRALRQGDAGVDQRIDFLARLLLTRPLAAEQRQVLADSYQKFKAKFTDLEAASALLAVGDSPVDDSLPADELAAWTLVASQLLNTDQALNK